MSDNDSGNDSILVMLGRIEAKQESLGDLVNQRFAATDQRIDDLGQSINQRIDDHKQETDQRFDNFRKETDAKIHRKSILNGASSGGLVVVLKELVEALFKGG